MKNNFTLISAILCAILSLANIQKAYCQEFDEINVFKEFPDSLLYFEKDFQGLDFNHDIRARLFQNPFYNDSITSFTVDSNILFGVEKDESLEYIETSQYNVIVNRDLNWINLNYYADYYWASLDFVLIPHADSYIIVLLKQYEEQFGMASVKEISYFYLDVMTNKYVKREISLPNLDWSDFYTDEDVSKLNMYYLEDVKPSYSISFFNIDKILTMRISVDLEDVTMKFLGLMDHAYTDGPNQWEDLDMSYDSLGFSQLSEANPLYFTYPDLQLLDIQEFELAYLYNSFCEKYANDLDIEFGLRDKIKAREKLLWNEHYSIDFIDSAMIITSEMMNKVEAKVILLNNGYKEYLVVCYNAGGIASESQLRILEKYKLSLKKEVPLDFIQTIKNEDFGIDYTENVFKKFPDVFKLKYEINQTILRISLKINPTFGDKEAEEIIRKIKTESPVLEFKWSEIIK